MWSIFPHPNLCKYKLYYATIDTNNSKCIINTNYVPLTFMLLFVNWTWVNKNSRISLVYFAYIITSVVFRIFKDWILPCHNQEIKKSNFKQKNLNILISYTNLCTHRHSNAFTFWRYVLCCSVSVVYNNFVIYWLIWHTIFG